MSNDPTTNILIVDDQPIIGEAVRRMLAPHPEYSLTVCTQGASALQTALDMNPDVILQDLVMPDADGLELVSGYRREVSLERTPLIVLSAREEATTKAEAFARGANDYLVKLPDPVELVARLRYHSSAHRARKERDEAFEALRAELNKAARYVESLIPEPMDGEVATQWRFVPSASLGGDSCGYHWLDHKRLAIYLLDVCGHGVGPALLSVSVINALTTGSMSDADPNDPGKVLTALNRLFPMSRHNGMFFTIWYGVADLDTRTLRYCGGGHPPALLVSPQGPVQRLGGDANAGPMIGAIPDIDYTTSSTHIDAGAALLVYSDGIHEITKPDGSIAMMDEFLTTAEAEVRQGGQVLDRLLANGRAVRGKDEFEDDVSLLQVIFR
jgi:sigma-B regulation protein RsbU (phosphoserine phosphatase)